MLDARRLRLVLFDLGGVVCRFVPERRLRGLARASGRSEEEIHRRLFESGFSRGCDRGEYDASTMHAEICERLAWSAPYAELRALWAAAFEPDPAVLALVDRVRATHATGILTDNAALLRDALDHELAEVGRRFDLLLFSFELGGCKPEPALFRAALARARRAAGEVLFVDDVAGHVEAAERAGIAGLHFTDPAALARDLASAL